MLNKKSNLMAAEWVRQRLLSTLDSEEVEPLKSEFSWADFEQQIKQAKSNLEEELGTFESPNK